MWQCSAHFQQGDASLWYAAKSARTRQRETARKPWDADLEVNLLSVIGMPFRQPDTSANRHLAWNTLLGGCYALGYQPSCLRFALHACEILGRDKRERDRPDVKKCAPVRRLRRA